MFRTGVQAEIGATERTGVEVVGEAADVDQAVSVIAATRPEVVLLDVHLPGGGGVEVLRRSAALMGDASNPVRFLALSVSDAADDVIGVIRGGARGYVTKTITGTDLVAAIFRVRDGDAVFSPRLAGFVLDAFASTDAPPVDEDLDRLTQREREVLRLIARGYAYKRLRVQGDSQAVVHLREDGRVPRLRGAAQAPALQSARADPLGHRAPTGLSERAPPTGPLRPIGLLWPAGPLSPTGPGRTAGTPGRSPVPPRARLRCSTWRALPRRASRGSQPQRGPVRAPAAGSSGPGPGGGVGGRAHGRSQRR